MEGIAVFFQQLTHMRWSDYLDIAIVTYLLYRLLPLFRKTGTSRIVVTVVAVIVISWLAEELKLYSFSFILDEFLQVGLIALVVLFQPELRRMLDHLGHVKLSKFFAGERQDEEMASIIAQTVQACETMSRERVGALIVFARENRLDEYFKTGTVINGQVSEQLIRNIFFPKASLHDGAMIIRDGQRYAQAPFGTPDIGAAAGERAVSRQCPGAAGSGGSSASEAEEEGEAE